QNAGHVLSLRLAWLRPRRQGRRGIPLLSRADEHAALKRIDVPGLARRSRPRIAHLALGIDAWSRKSRSTNPALTIPENAVDRPTARQAVRVALKMLEQPQGSAAAIAAGKLN